jgi:lysophospholipase
MSYQNTTHILTTQHDAFELFWQKWVPAEDTQRVLVFQHGIGEHTGRYQNLINAFEGTGTAFYALELRGHGRTRGLRGHITHFSLYSDDLRVLIQIAREENDNKKVFLLGHSLGGAIALHYALQAENHENLQGLMLSSPAIEVPLDIGKHVKVQLSSLLVKIIPSVIIDTHLDTRLLSHDPLVGDAFDHDPLTHGKISVSLGYKLFQLHKEFYAKAHTLHIPTYIFHGTGDLITSPEGSKKFYQLLRQPDKTIRLYDDLYHETMNEKEPDRHRVLQDLKDWVLNH